MTTTNEDYIEYDFTALLDHSKLGLIEVYALLFDDGEYEDYRGDDGHYYREIVKDPEFESFFYLDEEDNTVPLNDPQEADKVKRILCKDYWESVGE